MSGKDAELGKREAETRRWTIMLEQPVLLQHHLLWSLEQSPELHKLIVHSSCGGMAIKATSKISHSPLCLAHEEISLALVSLKPVSYSIVLKKGYKYFNLSDRYMYQ